MLIKYFIWLQINTHKGERGREGGKRKRKREGVMKTDWKCEWNERKRKSIQCRSFSVCIPNAARTKIYLIAISQLDLVPENNKSKRHTARHFECRCAPANHLNISIYLSIYFTIGATQSLQSTHSKIENPNSTRGADAFC